MSQQDNLFSLNMFGISDIHPMYKLCEQSWRITNGHKKIRIVTENDKDVKEIFEESNFIKNVKEILGLDSYLCRLLISLYIRFWVLYAYGGWFLESDMLLFDVLPKIDENFSYYLLDNDCENPTIKDKETGIIKLNEGTRYRIGTWSPTFYKKGDLALKNELSKVDNLSFDLLKKRISEGHIAIEKYLLLDNDFIENKYIPNNSKSILDIPTSYWHFARIFGFRKIDNDLILWGRKYDKIIFCVDYKKYYKKNETSLFVSLNTLNRFDEFSEYFKFLRVVDVNCLSMMILYYKFLAWKVKNVFNENVEDYIEIEDELLKMAEDSPIKFDLDLSISMLYKLFYTE